MWNFSRLFFLAIKYSDKPSLIFNFSTPQGIVFYLWSISYTGDRRLSWMCVIFLSLVNNKNFWIKYEMVLIKTKISTNYINFGVCLVVGTRYSFVDILSFSTVMFEVIYPANKPIIFVSYQLSITSLFISFIFSQQWYLHGRRKNFIKILRQNRKVINSESKNTFKFVDCIQIRLN